MFVFLMFVAFGLTIFGTILALMKGDGVWFISSLFVGFFFFFIVAVPVGKATYNPQTLTCTVTDKDRGSNGGGYRIYTEECGTLGNQDSLWRGKFDSADFQGRIQIGNTYEFELAGPRFGLFSWFPNVYAVVPVV